MGIPVGKGVSVDVGVGVLVDVGVVPGMLVLVDVGVGVGVGGTMDTLVVSVSQLAELLAVTMAV